MKRFAHFERGYLLPKGCKDIIDVINLAAQPQAEVWLASIHKPSNKPLPGNEELLISEPISVGQLASLLKQKPSKIIADLMELGVFATVHQYLGFKAAAQVARKYGYNARKAA